MKKKFTEDVLQNFEPERIPEKMIFIGNVEKGLLELDQGKTVPHDQVKEIIKQW